MRGSPFEESTAASGDQSMYKLYRRENPVATDYRSRDTATAYHPSSWPQTGASGKSAESRTHVHQSNGESELYKSEPEVGDPEKVLTISEDRQCHRKLVLHMDVRNTILVADSVTNVSVEQALNSFLTGVTWGQVEANGNWVWCSSEPSLTAPRPGAITYYKYMENRLVQTPSDRALLRQATGDFTQENIGKRFESYFRDHLRDLEWHYGSKYDKRLTMQGHDGKLYHYIIPAFYKLINYLYENGRDFSVIIRTYGMDAPTVLAATDLTMQGLHPQFVNNVPVSVNHNCGRITRDEDNKFVVEIPKSPSLEKSKEKQLPADAEQQVLTNERDIYESFNRSEGITAFVDDFRFWQKNGYHHSCAKPLWIDPSRQDVHHIFFDDNIRVTDDDSIVNLRVFDSAVSGESRQVEPGEVERFEDMCLVQADLMESTGDIDYFIDKVALCERNYDKYLQLQNGHG